MTTNHFIAFTLGLMGSAHCVLMCGPLAMSLHGGQRGLSHRLLYQSGRLLTYSLLGAVSGTFGWVINLIVPQQWLSVGIGIALLVAVAWRLGHFTQPALGRGLQSLRRRVFGRVSRTHPLGQLLLGSLNGLLPCGLVYTALSTAVLSPNALQGALFMLFFGLGTLPALMAVSWVRWPARLAANLGRAQTAAYCLVALLLIYRGFSITPPATSNQETPIPVCGLPH